MESIKITKVARVSLTMSVVVVIAVSASSASAYFQTGSVSVSSTKSTAVINASCKKVGVKQGLFTCQKVKVKLVLVRTKTNTATNTTTSTIASTTTSTIASTTTIPVTTTVLATTLNKSLCLKATYTAEVTNLTCSADSINFNSTGLPVPTNTKMVGITGTNQQYPRPHSYQFTFPLTPGISASPTTPDSGAIGVAINGVPLFSPWDQAAVRNHTLDTGELDVCGGHAGRGDDYHYHIAPKCLIDTLGENHVDVAKLPIGIANDGNPILALGWFRSANNIESKLDSCRGMKDTNGVYFYNVQTVSKWDVLNCFTNKVVNTSRDSWTSRTDSQGKAITGAKAAMTITEFSTVVASGVTGYVMKGTLRSQKVIQTDQSVSTLSSATAIFYFSSSCYAEFFEPSSGFAAGSVFYELVKTGCPQGFSPDSLPLLSAYAGPTITKRVAS